MIQTYTGKPFNPLAGEKGQQHSDDDFEGQQGGSCWK